MSGAGAGAGEVDPAERAKFDAMAADWWDPSGPMAPLHAMQPVRLDFILEQICGRMARDRAARAPLAGLRIADIGAGAGLLSAPMARLGAETTALEPAEAARAAGAAYAAAHGLAIESSGETAGALASEVASGARPAYDVALLFEVLEHAPDRPALLSAARALLKPGGLLLASTLNRTAQSWGAAILVAERLLGWLPKGTHDWRKFAPPETLAQELDAVGLDVVDRAGFVYDPLGRRWAASRADLSINYAIAAVRRG